MKQLIKRVQALALVQASSTTSPVIAEGIRYHLEMADHAFETANYHNMEVEAQISAAELMNEFGWDDWTYLNYCKSARIRPYDPNAKMEEQ